MTKSRVSVLRRGPSVVGKDSQNVRACTGATQRQRSAGEQGERVKFTSMWYKYAAGSAGQGPFVGKKVSQNGGSEILLEIVWHGSGMTLVGDMVVPATRQAISE